MRFCKHDRILNPCWPNVELSSTAIFAVPDPMTNSNRQTMLQCFISVFSKLFPYNSFLEESNIRDFLEKQEGSDCWNSRQQFGLQNLKVTT